MTAQLARTLSSLAAVALTAASCTSYYEIPIETPIRPKLDVTAFQRVFVAGFISGGSEDVDGNLETTRLLRSQLRTSSHTSTSSRMSITGSASAKSTSSRSS